MKIPIAKTVFTEEEYKCILKPLETGWVVQGPLVSKFEELWNSFTGAKHSVAVTSCTTALHLSLAAMDIKAGDEVIIPSLTWVATANAVESLGAKPVFCDIEFQTFNICTDKIEKLITKNTKAIIPVHLFGLSADMDKIMEIAKAHKLSVVEDAACGFASKYKGRHVGNFGDTGCFSFHPRKAITTGEGGMITTNNDELVKKLRAMRDHGAVISDHERHLSGKPYLLPDFPYLGFNYRMTDIQASIGCTQMARAEQIYEKRNIIAGKYDKFINENIPWLKIPFRNNEYRHGFQAYVCLFEPEKINEKNIEEINKKRNDFMDYLQSNGISTRPGTHAVHMLSYYKNKYNLNSWNYLNSYIAYYCSIAFPLFPSLTDEEFYYIAEKIKDYKN
ncbi:MAG: DegT/DnrJ/EryC1/StrS family aminotransferase [Ignavibacteriae bacterium]|nr:MAG: DegT/DnrJ/EryC1/StrS family aminotransferase [Ignavibacteriota bacterium]